MYIPDLNMPKLPRWRSKVVKKRQICRGVLLYRTKFVLLMTKTPMMKNTWIAMISIVLYKRSN